jgi:hypothetical protein
VCCLRGIIDHGDRNEVTQEFSFGAELSEKEIPPRGKVYTFCPFLLVFKKKASVYTVKAK